ncbi:MAG: VWA domain-containing protein [Magnetococcales bacterium]|nr:VWA domain-containing protein [Magnetococcales bacterium]
MIESFHWLRPGWLLALPLLVPLWWWLRRSRPGTGDWHRVCDPHLLSRLLRPVEPTPMRQHAPWTITMTAALTLLALAGPAWRQLPQPVYQKQTALVLLLDLSLSMDATDLKPSRLERARLKIADLLKRRREGTTGLIVFAGEAFTVTPLTSDTETIQAQLQALTTEIMPAPGSRADLGLESARRMFTQAGVSHGQILLITDGEPSAATLDKSRELRQSGYPVSVLAVGTPEGAPIPIRQGGFLQDAQGGIVIPRLDEAPLRALATEGEGRFARLMADDTDLNHLLAGEGSGGLDTTRPSTRTADLWQEEGPWLLLLVIPLAALGFRRGVLSVVLMLTLTQSALAVEWDSPWQRPDQRAHEKLNARDPLAAAELFTDPAWKGAALYRAGRFEEALHALEPLESADDWYNKGNALAQLDRLEESLRAYDEALKRNPQHADASHNREVVQKALKHSPPQPPKNSDPAEQSTPAEKKSDDASSPAPDRDKGEPKESGNPKDSSSGQDSEASPPSQDAINQLSKSEESEPTQPEGNDPSKRAETPSRSDPNSGESPEEKQAASEAEQRQSPESEARQADEQWLRRIPDDPGGLLRRKFLYQYQRLGQSRPEGQPW